MRTDGDSQAMPPDVRRARDLPPMAFGSPAVPADVIDAARNGHPWAYEHLFAGLGRPLRGFTAARGADDPDGVVNEVLAEAFRALAQFEGDEADFRAFAFHIARRRLIDEYRRKSRRPRLVFGDVPQTTAVDPAFGYMERTESAVALLDVLTEDQRDVVLLRIVADLSLADTAAVLDKPLSAVKSLQRRALARLKRELSDEGVSSTALRTMSGLS
jgi:RNA polymerase sigma factor (sigma-70 family)